MADPKAPFGGKVLEGLRISYLHLHCCHALSTCVAACTARLRYDNGDQLQPGLGPPSKPWQNLGNGDPPPAPTAGMVMVCSFKAPSDMTMPLGTINEG